MSTKTWSVSAPAADNAENRGEAPNAFTVYPPKSAGNTATGAAFINCLLFISLSIIILRMLIIDYIK
jgi:hypothetical protein